MFLGFIITLTIKKQELLELTPMEKLILMEKLIRKKVL